jgi:hypothetical protein
MDSEQAKKILGLYRPGTADRTDPSFDEAVEHAQPHGTAAGGGDKPEAELGQWFQKHCSSYLSIRGKFQQIPVPPGLKDRILTEVKRPGAKVIALRPMVLLRAAAVVALCLSLAALYWRSHGREDDFNVYRSRMARTAMQPYGMALRSHDLQSINTYLAGREAPTDYVLPEGISKAQVVGCAVMRWQGRPVSMICFRSGRPLAAGAETDLWLFVVDEASVRNAPSASQPVVERVSKLMTAAWSRGGKAYVLAGAGDEEFLRKYF